MLEHSPLCRAASAGLIALSAFALSTAVLRPAHSQMPLSNSLRASQAPNGLSAGSGTLLAMAGTSRLGHCPLKHTDVNAQISGYVARVSVKQTFQNTFKEKIEAVYTFPLPENAAVDEMTMRVGGRVIKGTIKKRDEARQIYENAKSSGYVTSLLDQERPNIFTQSVANIEPGEKVEIEIKYVDLLPYEAGKFSFTFPTVVGPRFIPGSSSLGKTGTGSSLDTDRVPDASCITPNMVAPGTRAGHDISIKVDIHAGVPIHDLASSLHEVDIKRPGVDDAVVTLAQKTTIANKDFVLSWGVAKETLQSGYLTHRDAKSGYFTLMLLPPKRVEAQSVSPKEMIFLIDCSGSQSGLPLEKAKETMNYILEHMNADDTFQILSFNNGVTQFAPRPLTASPEMRTRAKAFIKSLEARGGTWMGPAVEAACSIPADKNRLRIVVFMTDGYVGNDFEVRSIIRKCRGTSRWFPFGTGNSVNRFLIDGIAKDGGGEAEYVLLNSPGPVVGEKFYKRISSPVLTDVKLDFHNLPVKEVFPVEVGDVWAERPLYFKGRYLAPCSGTITLTGFAGGKPYRQDLKVVFPENQQNNAVIKSLWARAKVDRLMNEDLRGVQYGTLSRELQDEIIKTALEHQLMTQFTSFVAVDQSVKTGGGDPKLVAVPVETPEGVSGNFRSHGHRQSAYQQHQPSKWQLAAPGSGGGRLPGAPPVASMGARIHSPGDNQYTLGSNIPHQGYYANKKPSGFVAAESAYVKDTAAKPDMESKPLPVPASSAFTEKRRDKATANDESVKKEIAAGSVSNQSIDQLSKLDTVLQNLYSGKLDETSDEVDVQGGKVAVGIDLTACKSEVLDSLEKIGFQLVTKSGNSVSGRIPVKRLLDLCKLASVTKVTALILDIRRTSGIIKTKSD